MFYMTLQGGGSIVPLPKGYLKAAFELIRENGGVCISDEVRSDTYLTYLIFFLLFVYNMSHSVGIIKKYYFILLTLQFKHLCSCLTALCSDSIKVWTCWLPLLGI